MLQSITVKKLSGIVRKLQQKSTTRMKLEKLSSLNIIIKVIPWTARVSLRSKMKILMYVLTVISAVPPLLTNVLLLFAEVDVGAR